MANVVYNILNVAKTPGDTIAVAIGADSNNTIGTALSTVKIEITPRNYTPVIEYPLFYKQVNYFK